MKGERLKGGKDIKGTLRKTEKKPETEEKRQRLSEERNIQGNTVIERETREYGRKKKKATVKTNNVVLGNNAEYSTSQRHDEQSACTKLILQLKQREIQCTNKN